MTEESIPGNVEHIAIDDKVTVLKRHGEIVANPLEYAPSPKEAALMELLLSPDSHLLSVTARCEKAGISREWYYRCMKKPSFVDAMNAQLKANVRGYGAELVAIAMQHARKGSFPHLQLLMKMGAIFDEKQMVEHSGEVAITVRFVDPDAPSTTGEDEF